MKIEHAVWPTGVPPVCTANWAQEAWDKFAEGYRPSGYTGDAHDPRAYIIWSAQVLIADVRAEREGKVGYMAGHGFASARFTDALAAAETCRESRRAGYCALGTCFVCTVARLSRGENP